MRRILNYWEESITYPSTPVVVPVRSGFGLFEIEDCREFIQRNIYFLGYYEFRETGLIRQYLRAGDTFIDVGANIGWFTILAAHIVGQNGQVIAFEPSKKIYTHLQRNVQINSLNNVKLEEFALAHKNGVAILSGATSKNSGKGSITQIFNGLNNTVENVRTMRFDDYFLANNLKRVRFMKIDVEGAEMMVLQGARSLLEKRWVSYLIIEVNDCYLRNIGSSSTEVISFFRECGYHIFQIHNFGIRPLGPMEQISFANLFIKAS